MVSRVGCLVRYMTRWALLLFLLAAGGVSHWVARVGRGASLRPFVIGFSDRSALQLVVSIESLRSFVLECLAHLDEFSQGINSCLCAEKRCQLVIWGSFVSYVPVFLVGLAFEYFVFACLELCAALASSRLMVVMFVVVFAKEAMTSSSLCHDSLHMPVTCAERV